MKRTVLLFIAFFTLYTITAQTINISDCTPYYSFKEGTSWTTETYNSKDKLQSKQTYKVLKVTGTSNNITATINYSSTDAKGEEVFNDESTFTCKDGALIINSDQYMPSELLEGFSGMNIDIDAELPSYPKTLKVGQKLDDGSIKMKIYAGLTMNLNVFVENREVESKENVQVPAGSFEAFKINSTIRTTGIARSERKTVEFISEKVGVVRTESLNKKGKLQNYTVLTEFN